MDRGLVEGDGLPDGHLLACGCSLDIETINDLGQIRLIISV